jgi:hypothetical protein
MALETITHDSILELRKKYRGYMPWQLAEVPGETMLYEFTSWPWQEYGGGEVRIMARPIDDPTANRQFTARKEIHPVRWSSIRQKAYRAGFKAGFAYAAAEARKYAELVRRPISQAEAAQ